MKKIILSAVFMMAVVFGASAQDYKWFIGADVNAWFGDNADTYGIAPEVGYNISSKFAIAAKVGYMSVKPDGGDRENGFYLNPYVRYTFLKKGIVSAFIDGGAEIGLSDADGLKAGIKPGIAIGITNRLSAVAHFGFLGYNDGKGVFGGPSFLQDGDGNKGFGLDLSSTTGSVGFYYSF